MPDQPWYREWRHDELAREKRLATDKRRLRRREKAKQIFGRALLVGAIVLMFWSIKDTIV